MVMEVRPVQFLKALLQILVTELGMVIDVRPVQKTYLQVALYQRFTY